MMAPASNPVSMRSASLGLVLFAACAPASAHVKWFSRAADCAMPPLSPLAVVSSPDFLFLGATGLLVMAVAALLDVLVSRPGARLRGLADAVHGRAADSVPHLVRLALAAFFCVAVLYFDGRPVYLTPELGAPSAWVPTLQLSIAAALLRRSTAWLGGLGIAVLYAAAVADHGWFHLLDYPVFLGAAAFVAIDSLGRGQRTAEALAVLRVTAAVTLMWGGAEKWLYPWWSDEVLDHQLREVRGSFPSSFFIAAAGWVEFCAAYALMFGRLGAQVAAVVLLVPFVGAVSLFGPLDAVGHAPIIVVLVVLAATRNTLPKALQGAAGPTAPLERAVSCTLAALATVGAYWSLHAIAYGTRTGADAVVGAAMLMVPLVVWWLPRLHRVGSGRSGTPAAAGI